MQADSPWALLLLIPWAVAVWWMIQGTLRLQGNRKKIAIALRALILLLVIAIAAGVQPYWRVEQRNVIFVADRSASVNADASLGEWIAKASAAKDEGDRSGIVSIGLDAVIDKVLSTDELPSAERYTFRSGVNENFTDLSQALRLASGMLHEAGGGKIVLLSDGAENAGSMLRQAELLKHAGIEVDVVPIAAPQRVDASLEAMDVPQTLRQGEKFTFEFTINSTSSGTAKLRLYEDNRELSTSDIVLEPGENRFALQSAALEPGFHRFRAELYAEGDEQGQNNTAYAFSRVSGPPAVLIVEGVPDSSGNVEAALKASLIRYETIPPERLSVQLASYAAYDSIILNNVPATRIAAKPMEWLGKAVSDYGIGLVMLGGDNSFGLGGYFQTTIEKALPVYMDLKGKRQLPSLGLILVIDRSGSMSGGKLELAKEAAMRTIELMRPEDSVGVVAFDSAPWWIVEPTKLTNRDDVLGKIQGIQADGGTEIFPALDTAYNKLLEMDAQRKHIILLTDGQSASNPGYAALTQGMVDNKMTMSTVAVGDGADQVMLEQLAKQAKGRFYFTNDESTLPAIFSRETVLMSRTYIVEQNAPPLIGQAGSWATMWQNGLPDLQAYIATTAKETAEVALLSPQGDPILARWAYGSGRTVAWTSDLTGKWSRDWVQWSALPNVLAEWIKWTFPQFESTPYSATAELDGREAMLRLRTEGTDTAAKLSAVVTDETGTSTTLSPLPAAPGEYAASLPVSEPGVYLMQVSEQTAAAGAATPNTGSGTTTGFVIPYSPEYRLTGENGAEALQQLATATGGRLLSLDAPQEVYRFNPVESGQPYDWTRELLLLILALWLLDILLRRLSLPWQRIGRMLLARLGLAGGRLQRKEPAAAVPSGAMSRLQQRKSRTAGFYGEQAGTSDVASASPASGQAKGAGADLAGVQRAAIHSSQTASGSNRDQAVQPEGQGQAGKQHDRQHKFVGTSSQPSAPPANPETNPADGQATVNRLLAAKKRGKR
ncbi:VWA domain-containing protein [Paenibacillus algorifonticola]|uniref:VWA domain-containing protein n=1 Tax=Paenibacillus algorifonticola TaxID=684063 RepID=UPI003D2B2C7D